MSERLTITQQEAMEFLQDWVIGKTILCPVCKQPIYIDLQKVSDHIEIRHACDCGEQILTIAESE